MIYKPTTTGDLAKFSVGPKIRGAATKTSASIRASSICLWCSSCDENPARLGS